MWKTQQTLPPLQPKYAHFYKTWRVFVKKAIPFDLVIDDFLNKTWYFIQKFQLPCLIIRGFQLPSYLYNSLYLEIFFGSILMKTILKYFLVTGMDGWYPISTQLAREIRPYLMLCWAPLEFMLFLVSAPLKLSQVGVPWGSVYKGYI